jgi:hypothetical protein
VKGVCKLVEVLDLSNQGERLKKCCCKGCTELEVVNNQGLLCMPQGVHTKRLHKSLSGSIEEAREG